MPFNRWTNKENVAHVHNEYYTAIKKNEIMEYSSKWMKLEKIMQCEATQIQEDKATCSFSSVVPSLKSLDMII